MSGLSIPSDDDLRQFLLGALPEERVAVVRAWLDADPAHAARLSRFVIHDEFTAAVGGGSAGEPCRVENAIEPHRPQSGGLPLFARHRWAVMKRLCPSKSG